MPIQRNDLEAIDEIKAELEGARYDYPDMRSAHEGFSIIKEEVDELWDEVKKRPSQVQMKKLRAEAKQVAAMAIRFMSDICASK